MGSSKDEVLGRMEKDMGENSEAKTVEMEEMGSAEDEIFGRMEKDMGEKPEAKTVEKEDVGFSKDEILGRLGKDVGEKPGAEAVGEEKAMADDSGSVDGMVWGTGEELLLALAVERYGRSNWDRVASELQSRPLLLSLPPFYFTPEICKSEFLALEQRYTSNASAAKQNGESLPWIEELKQRRIAYLKHQIEICEVSLQLRLEKWKRLKAEREKELLAQKSVHVSVENSPPASLCKLSDVRRDGGLSSDDEDPRKATQSSDHRNACNDDLLTSEMAKESIDGKPTPLPLLLAVDNVAIIENSSLANKTTTVNEEEDLVPGMDGLHLNSMSLAKDMVNVQAEAKKLSEGEENPVTYNVAKNVHGVIQKEFIVEENHASENLNESCSSVKSLERAAKTSSGQSICEASNLESVDGKSGAILPPSPETHGASILPETQKAEATHKRHEVIETYVEDAILLQRDMHGILMKAEHCATADDVSNRMDSEKIYAAKGESSGLEENHLLDSILRVVHKSKNSFDKEFSVETSDIVNNPPTKLHLELVSSSDNDLPKVIENEIIHEGESQSEASQPHSTVETFASKELVSPSKDADQVSTIATMTESLKDLPPPACDNDLPQNEPNADLDIYERCLRENACERQQASSFSQQANVSEDIKVEKCIDHPAGNTVDHFDLDKFSGGKAHVPQVSRANIDLQTDAQESEHTAPEVPEEANLAPAILNSVEQRTASDNADDLNSGRPYEQNASKEESSKHGKVNENPRKVNSIPSHDDHIAIDKVVQNNASEIVASISLLAKHQSENKNYRYRNREGSDESEQAFVQRRGQAVDTTQLRGEVHDWEMVDMVDIIEEKAVDMERNDDNVTASPVSLEQSLAAFGSKISSMSHEGSDSAYELSKDADGQQATRDYGDSQADRSEVGSPADGVDDTSLTSKRHRREPRVPGKLQPLLECLRLICAHKFAPLFKQKQESQDSHQYDLLIRRHMDLGMIRARLEEGAYSGSLEFFRDVLLIFQNALVYYPKDSQEYGAATVLRKFAMEEMDKIFRTEASLKQDRPATRKRDSRKFSDAAKQVRAAGTTLSESRKRDQPRFSTANEFPSSEPVLESEGRSKSVSLSMGGPSSRGDDADNCHTGDQEVDGHFRGVVIKPTKFTSQNFGREESQTLQELRYHAKASMKEEPKDLEKGTFKRPAKNLEHATSSGDAPEPEKKAVKLRSSLKGSRNRDFPNKTSKISMMPQTTTAEEMSFQNPVRASRSLKHSGPRSKEIDNYNSVKKRVKR